MKKHLLLILSIIISTLSFAQSSISFGARVGLSLAGMKGDAVNNLNNLLTSTNGMISTRNSTRFFTGMYATIPLSNEISLEPALYYSQKGYGLNGSLILKGIELPGTNAKAQIQSHYIDMPLVLKANLGGLQLFAGPQISYLMHANLQTSAGILGINFLNSKIDATNQFNRWDAAITGGLGYQFAKGLNLTASYDYGLSKIDASRNIHGYNSVVKVGLGIQF